MESGTERFTVDDLYELSDIVAAAWAQGAERDWSAPAGSLDWSCTNTADHAIDCVYAPAFFLASRKLDGYPEVGADLTLGPAATPEQLVQSLGMATRILAAVVNDAPPETRAVIFRRPEILTAAPEDFVPRGALELILHAHDVCTGLHIPFEPRADLCHRLREHTRAWPYWTSPGWSKPRSSEDAWLDLLVGSGRS